MLRTPEDVSAAPGSPARGASGLRVSLRLRTLITLGLLSTFSALVVWGTLLSYFHEDKATYIRDSALDIASNKALALELQLQRQLDVVGRLGGEYKATGDATSLQTGLQASPDAILFALYAEDGEIRAGYARSALLTASGIVPKEFQRSRRRLDVSPRYVRARGVVVYNTTVDAALPAFAVTAPVEVESPRELLFLRAEFLAEPLLRALEHKSGFDVSVVDHNGEFFAHPDSQRMLPRARAEAGRSMGTELAAELGAGTAGAGRFDDSDGEPYLAAHVPVNTGRLDVVVRRPLADAFLAADRLRARSLHAALVVIVVTGLIAVVASGVLTRRLAELGETARRLRAGDFEARIAEPSNDEIGDLAESLNLAAQGLAERDTQLRETHAQLLQSEKLASFGRFSAGIVHEVKNPLAAIGMSAELGLEQLDDREAVERYLRMICRETTRSDEILQSLLGFARDDGSSFELLAVNDVIAELGQIMAPQLRSSDVTLHLQHEAEPDRIRGERTGLTQVLMNLVLNAADALQDSAVKRITIGTRAIDRDLEVRVVDSGPGVPDGIRDKIFDPFFTSKPEGRGTGLGLYVTHTIVGRHGGLIEVTNEPGGGAAFTLRFPLADPAEPRPSDAVDEQLAAPV